jgi:hypothetical protein
MRSFCEPEEIIDEVKRLQERENVEPTLMNFTSLINPVNCSSTAIAVGI